MNYYKRKMIFVAMILYFAGIGACKTSTDDKHNQMKKSLEKRLDYKVNIHDFLEDKDEMDKLYYSLDKSDFASSDFKIIKDYFYTNKIDLIKLVNRFIANEDKSTLIPYWILRIKIVKERKSQFCITQTPEDIDPNFDWTLPKEIEIEGREKIKDCMFVENEEEFMKIDKKVLISKYFKNGILKIEYRDSLNLDPDFIYALIEKGFYVYDDCVSGRISIAMN